MSFLLDIIKVPELHTGAALTNVFQAMLEHFELKQKVSY